jgi:type IV pilus assembly protein PilA
MNPCPKCGTFLQENARFCANCGALNTGAPGMGAAGGQQTSTKAILALVFSLIPFCFMPVVGIVLGVMARKEIRARPHQLKGDGLALAAIIIGSIFAVISVIGMLAAIAIPNFIRFQARSKQSEAKMNLRAIYVASQSSPGATLSDIGFSPEPRRRYTYFYGEDALQADLGGPYSMPDDIPEGVRAVAVGNVDNDDTLDVWMLQADGELTQHTDDITE